MIKLNNISFLYGKQRVLNGFTLTVNDGEKICLFGPSGCGKTTVLRIIAGLETPSSGKAEITGKVSIVFQEDRLIPSLTVKQNVLVAAGDDTYVYDLGLGDAADKFPADLSGGMARRVEIARAVAYGGDILLLDEPFNGLDDESREAAARLILHIYSDKTIVAVSHREEDAELLNAKIINMSWQDV